MQIDPSKIIDGANSISKTSLELAEAASDLGALRVFFGIAMVVFIVIGLIAGYSLWNLSRKISKIAESSEHVLSYFNDLSKRSLGKEEAKAIIREALEKMSAISKYYILRIRWENHIEDREATCDKVERMVDGLMLEFSYLVDRFLYMGKPLSTPIDLTEKDPIMKMYIFYIYQDPEHFAPSKMSDDLDIFFKGLKIRYQDDLEDF